MIFTYECLIPQTTVISYIRHLFIHLLNSIFISLPVIHPMTSTTILPVVFSLPSTPSVSHPTNPSPPHLHQALEAKAEKALSAIEKEEKLKKQLDDQNAKLTRERDELLSALDEEKGSISDYHAKQQKLQAQKKQLEKQLQVRSRWKQDVGIGDMMRI